eukprot:180385-Amorphochlora_amoeboformis.AAC.2
MASRLLTIASRPACFPLSQRSRCIVLRQCRRSLFMSRSWYKPEVGKDGKDQLHGKQPRVLYDNVSPVQTRYVHRTVWRGMKNGFISDGTEETVL